MRDAGDTMIMIDITIDTRRENKENAEGDATERIGRFRDSVSCPKLSNPFLLGFKNYFRSTVSSNIYDLFFFFFKYQDDFRITG